MNNYHTPGPHSMLCNEIIDFFRILRQIFGAETILRQNVLRVDEKMCVPIHASINRVCPNQRSRLDLH